MKKRYGFYAHGEMQKTNFRKMSSNKIREMLREKGQFWTPDWISKAMVEYVLADCAKIIFDPAVGAGAFFRAAKTIAKEKGLHITLMGMDIDPGTLQQSLQYGLTEDDIAHIKIGDFVLQPPQARFSAIVANPPYIRHHRLSKEQKEQLKRLSFQITGKNLDSRAGLHVYFLIRALSLLENNGRLAFIVSADICEGKFATELWHWVTREFLLEAVVTFQPEASPFPQVDVNPVIFFIRKSEPRGKFLWAKCCQSETDALANWVRSGLRCISSAELVVIERDLSEGISTGLSREPMFTQTCNYMLGDFVRVVRGVATGANSFFFMTEERAKLLGIPHHYFVRAVGRTRDVLGEEITEETIEILKSKGRPTLLLTLTSENIDNYPESVKQYLREGEMMGLPRRPLISRRKPWYKMETREVPPFIFAYLGRRNSRFIRNTAKVIPLTSFLCVYPKKNDERYIEQVWKILSHPEITANLRRVGKTYGGGAIKVEPRLLEKLPIPDSVVEQSGLRMQRRLFEQQKSYEAFNHEDVPQN